MQVVADDEPDPVFEIVPVIGEQPIRELVAAFYRRVERDDLLRPMYPPGNLAAPEKRLADFLVFRCGGPQTYLSERGHPQLRMRHAPFAVDQSARDRWVELMDAAFDNSEFPEPQRTTLRQFLHATATVLINRPS